ncbi:hypothetical protein ABIB83_007962 [Bradyrhizobium sp. I1.8.5]|uniref:TIR domain-containing protein n=1 Tax=Bradyrhizobium sp. I1.8.5 TaxID=3156365 RepID=UPI0033913D4E
MKIFISHKMPADTPAVTDFGNRLALYAGNAIEISHAGKFDKGADFRTAIEEEILSSDMFILYYTSDSYDWSFCIFECGIFKAHMAEDTKRKLIVLRGHESRVPESLSNLNSVTATAADLASMIREIYLEEPWRVKPDLGDGDIADLAGRLVAIFERSRPSIVNFDLVPNFVIELDGSSETERSLITGLIPERAVVAGSQGWQALFGKVPDTGAWIWRELVEDWDHRSLYEFEIAAMIVEALARNTPKGCYLRRPNSPLIFRLSLRRFERTLDSEVQRFYFTAAPMDVESYWLPEDTQDKSETKLFHLVNVSWFVRRRLIEMYYEKMLNLLSQSKRDDAQLDKLVKDVYHELIVIEIQSVIRGIDNPRVVLQALDKFKVQVHSKSPDEAIDSSWNERKKLVFDCMTSTTTKDYHAVAQALYALALENGEYYRISAAAYAAEAQLLPDVGAA